MLKSTQFSIMDVLDMCFIVRFSLLFLICFTRVFAGPWLTPSEPWIAGANLATKSDITLLADYGFIEAPILTWPLSWDNIGPSLLSPTSQMKLKKSPPFVQQTYFRVLSQYRNAIQRTLKPAAYISGGHQINPFRTFEFQPRSDVQGGASLEKQDNHWAVKLAVDYGQYDDVTQNVHLDDSYAYGFIGNWALGFDKTIIGKQGDITFGRKICPGNPRFTGG